MMTFKARRKGLAVGLALAMTALVLSPVVGQQQTPYSIQEYQVYKAAIDEPNLGKREDAIIGFMKANPDSKLTEYGLGNYVKLLQAYQKQGNHRKVVSAGEKLLALNPNEPNALQMVTYAAFQSRQLQKAAQYGEKFYGKMPSAGLAYILALSYGTKNQAKYISYGEKAVAALKPAETYQIVAELTNIYVTKKQWQKASEYGRKTIRAFSQLKKPQGTSQAEWDKYVKMQTAIAHGAVGRNAAESRNWGGAISSYSRALRNTSERGLRGEAYFYIGMGRWQQNRIDDAMTAFARGSVQRGAPHAKHCRKHLEQLYKSTHNDSLAGIEEFVERVT
ncbi:MAG: hypothetical protein OXT71_13850 [Acidobacteriota bacterium]|nr:hypothetical protein [Acidobacteriota bacterium]